MSNNINTFLTNTNLVKHKTKFIETKEKNKLDILVSENTSRLDNEDLLSNNNIKLNSNSSKKLTEKDVNIKSNKYSANITNNKKSTNKIRKTLYDKIKFLPPHPEYYKNFPFKPGINFIKSIFDHDNAEKAIKKLKINIPETYWSSTEIFYAYNDPDTNELCMIKNKRHIKVFENFIKVEKDLYNREFISPKDNIQPVFVVRSGTNNFNYENYTLAEKYETAQDSSTNDNSHGILQRYIRSKGKNRKLLKENKYNVTTNTLALLSKQNKYNAVSSHTTKKDNDDYTINNNNYSNLNDSKDSHENKLLPNIHKNQNVYNTIETKQYLSNDESFIKTNYINESNKFKSYTKPSIIRVEYKTRYNSSKNVMIYIIIYSLIYSLI